MSQDRSPSEFATHTEGEGETLDLPEGMRTFTPGQVLGERYEIKGLLGRGGMGEVWHAFDLKLRVEVALKALRPEFFRSERRLGLLRDEVRAAREVVSPNVCRIFDLIEIDGRELVSMEYVDGATLLAVLSERGPLDLKEAQDIASQFLAGLEAIHKVGLVHRDIKPENIMVTRAGRVVVMDFGLARQSTEGGGSVSGTPAYMSPEQAAGQSLDERADVYSAGVVLAEMVCPDGITNLQSRQSVWEGVRSEPAKVPDTPWAAVIRKAVAKDREQRFNTAHTLTRALEDVTLRVEGAEDLHPYPGLASFTEEDAEYFFGREAEVEQMWRRLDGPPRMLALVGSSGAGKSSFLRAGVVPSRPPGWASVLCTPGSDPRAALRRALISELEGDGDALRELAEGSEDATVSAVIRWSHRHERTMVLVDQFEELFTQNTPEEQARFTALLGRLVLEADVVVMLSMRDDFLIHCNRHEPLRPLFSELTPLDPPIGGALRRALVQPAMQCGYRLEDDELVDEMLAEVEGERGALPLLAFAMEQLWSARDRESGLLTRQAYRDIGGVGGALARHAEATVDRIGHERIPIVRELFRNLVTAEGTRAVREWDDLLSVFGSTNALSASIRFSGDPSTRSSDSLAQDDRCGVAEEVLRELVDARLLTSYEVENEDRGSERRVEIIHESLLANWPRLVRWQTQDADAAQLRDQLRQAAKTWDEHDRSDDLLWTGGAYREFAVWRESYPGGLSETEQAFSDAMARHAALRRRRRRMMVAAVLVVAAAVAAVTTTLWRRSVIETRRAQATTLLMKAQTEIEDTASSEEALPYAIASLELWDQPAARRMALRALGLAPPVWLAPPRTHVSDLAFSPDGAWLASIETFEPGEVYLVPAQGGDPLHWQVHSPELEDTTGQVVWFSFVSDAVLATFAARDPVVRLWSVPEGRALQTLPPYGKSGENFEDMWRAFGFFRRLSRFSRQPDGAWVQDTRGIDRMAEIGRRGDVAAAVDGSGELLAYQAGGDLVVENLGDPGAARRLVGHSEAPLQHIAWSPSDDHIATWQPEAGMALWSLGDGSLRPRRTWAPDELLNVIDLAFDPTGGFLTAGVTGKNSAYVWDLAGPPAAEPWRWARKLSGTPFRLAFDPTSSWLAAAFPSGVALWTVERGRYPYRFRGHTSWVRDLAFAPDGSWLVSSSDDGTVRWWPLTEAAGAEARVLFDWGRPWVRSPVGNAYSHFIAVAPDGAWVAVTGEVFDTVHVVPVSGGEPRELRTDGEPLEAVAVDPDGRRLAVGAGAFPELGAILIWDLESDAVTRLEVAGWVVDLQFLSDGSLIDVVHRTDRSTVGRWNLATLEREEIDAMGGGSLNLSADGRYHLRVEWDENDDPFLALADQVGGTSDLVSRNPSSWAMDLSSSGRIAVFQAGDRQSFVVRRVTGGHSHRLLVQNPTVCAISPDERWIATGDRSGDILLWPMPDLDRRPLDSLPHDELIATLKALTNVRAVPDDESTDGWGVRVDPFPGWETVPEW